MSATDPRRALRLALVGWGLGHLALGRRGTGIALLAAELAGIALVAWVTVGLADTSAYLVPYLSGIAFIVAWAWQAIAAYRTARAGIAPARMTGTAVPPERSPAFGMVWLSLPLLVWGAGFWLVAAESATPAAVLDRFVTAWMVQGLEDDAWPAAVVAEAEAAAERLGSGPDLFRDVRVRVDDVDGTRATAVAEAIHYERREARFLGIFGGSELVPVADAEVLRLELVAEPVGLPGAGTTGAVRWKLAAASAGR